MNYVVHFVGFFHTFKLFKLETIQNVKKYSLKSRFIFTFKESHGMWSNMLETENY